LTDAVVVGPVKEFFRSPEFAVPEGNLPGGIALERCVILVGLRRGDIDDDGVAIVKDLPTGDCC